MSLVRELKSAQLTVINPCSQKEATFYNLKELTEHCPDKHRQVLEAENFGQTVKEPQTEAQIRGWKGQLEQHSLHLSEAINSVQSQHSHKNSHVSLQVCLAIKGMQNGTKAFYNISWKRRKKYQQQKDYS